MIMYRQIDRRPSYRQFRQDVSTHHGSTHQRYRSQYHGPVRCTDIDNGHTDSDMSVRLHDGYDVFDGKVLR